MAYFRITTGFRGHPIAEGPQTHMRCYRARQGTPADHGYDPSYEFRRYTSTATYPQCDRWFKVTRNAVGYWIYTVVQKEDVPPGIAAELIDCMESGIMELTP